MSYTITRENAVRDLEALKAILDNDGIVESDVKVLEEITDSIEEQVKPAIEEPKEFGSIVRAGIDGVSDRVLWVRSASGYWFSAYSQRATFGDFHEPEVLRVGIGDDSQAAQDDAYLCGRRDFGSRLRKELVQLASSAVTAPEKRCYDTVIAKVAALSGES